jgi:hypothetical protein
MIKMEKRNQTYPKAKIVEEIVKIFKNDTLILFFYFKICLLKRNFFAFKSVCFQVDESEKNSLIVVVAW